MRSFGSELTLAIVLPWGTRAFLLSWAVTDAGCVWGEGKDSGGDSTLWQREFPERGEAESHQPPITPADGRTVASFLTRRSGQHKIVFTLFCPGTAWTHLGIVPPGVLGLISWGRAVTGKVSAVTFSAHCGSWSWGRSDTHHVHPLLPTVDFLCLGTPCASLAVLPGEWPRLSSLKKMNEKRPVLLVPCRWNGVEVAEMKRSKPLHICINGKTVRNCRWIRSNRWEK